jgi:hypothetical protein
MTVQRAFLLLACQVAIVAPVLMRQHSVVGRLSRTRFQGQRADPLDVARLD